MGSLPLRAGHRRPHVREQGVKAIQASNGWVNGAGMVTAAKIIAWINIVVGLLFIGFLIFAVIVGLFSSDADTNTTNFNALMTLFRPVQRFVGTGAPARLPVAGTPSCRVAVVAKLRGHAGVSQ